MSILATTVALLVAPATARADDVPPNDALYASMARVGVVTLGYRARLGSQVHFYERVGDRVKPLGVATVTTAPIAGLPGAVRWRCDRLVRRFLAIAIAPDGSRSHDSYDVRTPSCADRLRLSVPHRLALGASARVRVKDRWKHGGMRPRLCVTPPHAPRSCRVLAFPSTVDIAGRPLRANKRGVWRVELRLHGHRTREAVAVGGARYVSPAPSPTVLATGGSMMGGIDGYLGDRLAGTATVRSDVRPATGVSRGLEWLSRPAAQTKRYRPRVTVIMMGDLGYSMQTPEGVTRECCDAAWAAEYMRRARLMMKAYIRRGRGRVLWLTMPSPQSPEFAGVMNVVNVAVLRAVAGLPGARVLRLDLLFAPEGYRAYVPYRGQTVRVRQSDGVHFTATGAAIAAEAVEEELRATPGWLRPGR